MKKTRNTKQHSVSSRYERATNDRDLVGLYEIWDHTLERNGHSGEHEYAAKVIHRLFMAELKKRGLTKSRFLTTLRSAISNRRTSSSL